VVLVFGGAGFLSYLFYKEVEMIVIEGLNHYGITVSNLERSIKFYRDYFDFEIIDRISTPEQAYIRMGDIIIGLQEVEGYRASDDLKHRISFSVDEEDFEDALDEIESSEIEIVYGPEHIRNGQTVIILDPDGNQIELTYPRID